MTKLLGNELAVKQDSVVANLEQARAALAEAKTIGETKKIVDIAAAAEIYAKRQHLGDEAIGIASSIRIEALRQLGGILKATPRATGAVPNRNSVETPPTLSELGLDRKTSAIAQKLAELPLKQFEEVRSGNETVTKVIAAVKKTKHTSVPVEKEEVTHGDEDLIAELSDTVNSLAKQNEELKDRLSVEGMEATEDEKLSAAETIAALRKENKTLKATLDSVTKSRDSFQGEAAELKKQIQRQRREIDKLTKK